MEKLKEITHEEWKNLIKTKYESFRSARFICPMCKNVQSIDSVMQHNPELEIDEIKNGIYYNCEGRHTEFIGCNYSMDGLLKIDPINVKCKNEKNIHSFQFTDLPISKYNPSCNMVKTRKELDQLFGTKDTIILVQQGNLFPSEEMSNSSIEYYDEGYCESLNDIEFEQYYEKLRKECIKKYWENVKKENLTILDDTTHELYNSHFNDQSPLIQQEIREEIEYDQLSEESLESLESYQDHSEMRRYYTDEELYKKGYLVYHWNTIKIFLSNYDAQKYLWFSHNNKNNYRVYGIYTKGILKKLIDFYYHLRNMDSTFIIDSNLLRSFGLDENIGINYESVAYLIQREIRKPTTIENHAEVVTLYRDEAFKIEKKFRNKSIPISVKDVTIDGKIKNLAIMYEELKKDTFQSINAKTLLAKIDGKS